MESSNLAYPLKRKTQVLLSAATTHVLDPTIAEGSRVAADSALELEIFKAKRTGPVSQTHLICWCLGLTIDSRSYPPLERGMPNQRGPSHNPPPHGFAFHSIASHSHRILPLHQHFEATPNLTHCARPRPCQRLTIGPLPACRSRKGGFDRLPKTLVCSSHPIITPKTTSDYGFGKSVSLRLSSLVDLPNYTLGTREDGIPADICAKPRRPAALCRAQE